MFVSTARRCAFVLACLVALTSKGAAHEGQLAPPALTWQFEPGPTVLLVISALLYGIGVTRLWRRLGMGRGARWSACVCFWMGWVATAGALISPLHAWGSTLFAAHMVQHEILMLIAAPLLILGRPLPVCLWALPRAWRRKSAGAINKGAFARSWRFLTLPFVAWALHALILWVWHIPAFFEATLTSEMAHALQHSSFLGSALIFWYALFQGHRRKAANGTAVMYLFTTALHTGVLGALLTFAPTPWYPAYHQTARLWGLTGLEDQQLGGLIMWIPGGVVYIVAGLVLFADWLREASVRVDSGEASANSQAAAAR
jgi:putative membrane protein